MCMRIAGAPIAAYFHHADGGVAIGGVVIHVPAGEHTRVDTHIESGSQVPPFYDSLLAKIVIQGRDRAESIERMKQALANCHIDEITDFNRIRTYTAASFHRDMTHLYGEGWEQRYAGDLRKYLSELPD